MNRDAQPTVCLEVIIPSINLPIATKAQQHHSTEIQDAGKIDGEEEIQLQSLTTHQPFTSKQGRPSTHTTRHILFRFLQMQANLTQGQNVLLQIFRPATHDARTAQQDGSSDVAKKVTDEIPFSVEYRQTTSSPSQIEIIPGLTRVTIDINEEGSPTGYCVDGAES